MNGWLLEQEIDLSQPISRQYTSPYGIALTGDDRAQRLRYTVYDGQDDADLSGTVKVYYRRPDDTLIESTSGGDYVTVSGNIVTAELPPEAYEQKGTVECLVKLYASDGKVVTLARCDIEVRRGVENDETIIPAGEASRASLEDRVAALEVATGVVPIDQLPTLPHNPQTGDYLEVEDGNGPYKIDYVALADAIIERSAALKKDFSILPIAPNPYTGTELIPLYRGGVNYRTDMTTLLQSAGGGGGTQQSALVNYYASYQLSAGTISTTFTDSNLTANMIIVQWYTSDDVTLSLTPTIADGSLTLAGTVSAATTIAIYFGVGLTAAPTLLVNLASNSSDNILKTNPRPGVYGSLKVANGGTGADSAAGARNNLDVYSTTEVDDAISQSTASSAITFTPESGIYSNLFVRKSGNVVSINGYLTATNAFPASETLIGTIADGARPLGSVRCAIAVCNAAYEPPKDFAYLVIGSSGRFSITAKSGNTYKVCYFNVTYVV